MAKDKVNNILSFKEAEKSWKPEEAKKTKRTDVALDILKEGDEYMKCPACGAYIQYDAQDREIICDECGEEVSSHGHSPKRFKKDKSVSEEADISKFSDFENVKKEVVVDVTNLTVTAVIKEEVDDNKIVKFSDLNEAKEEKQPEFTILGEEKELKSNPLFGYAAVRDQEIKKIGAFSSFTKMKDPPSPKERQILNAGQWVETDEVKGYINRVDGSRVFVESADEPMKIVEIKLKDAVKIPKEKKDVIKFSEL